MKIYKHIFAGLMIYLSFFLCLASEAGPSHQKPTTLVAAEAEECDPKINDGASSAKAKITDPSRLVQRIGDSRAIKLAQIVVNGRPHVIATSWDELTRKRKYVDLSLLFDQPNASLVQLKSSVKFAAVARALESATAKDLPTNAKFLPPVQGYAGAQGATSMGVGFNFPEHTAETKQEHVDPVLFAKVSSPTAGDDLKICYKEGGLLDYEIELAVVGSDLFATSIDFSRREHVILNGKKNTTKAFTLSKSGAEMLPISQSVLWAENPDSFAKNLNLSLTVDGEIRQSSNSCQMVEGHAAIRKRWQAALEQKQQWQVDDKGHKTSLPPFSEETIVQMGTPSGVAFKVPGFASKMSAVSKSVLKLFTKGPRKHIVSAQTKNPNYLRPNQIIKAQIDFLDPVQVQVVDCP